ncbi:MAG: hypothetical protein QM484_11750 [Woeseiaceae bacterium]
MIRKTLTYLTILAITALPVQLINADVEVISMSHQMSQTENQCMLDEMTQQHDANSEINSNSMDKSCCDDESHTCQSCDNCPQAITAMFLSTDNVNKPLVLKSHKIYVSYLSLNGISQKNPQRPPRTLI